MIYVGVDIAKAEHCLGAIDDHGRVVHKPIRFDQTAAGWKRLAAILGDLGGPLAVTIGFEATGHYWILLAEELRRLGYTPQVFNPILTGDACRISVRGRKTDEDDCLAIATVLRDKRFSAVALPDEHLGVVKQLARHRQAAVSRSANLKKRLNGLLDLVFPEFTKLFSDPYCPTARAILKKAPSAYRLSQLQTRNLVTMVRKVSHGRLGSERVQQVISAAKTSIAAQRRDRASELAITMTLEEIDLLDQQIAVYEQEIAALPMPDQDLLVSIPGIGPILAAVILAEIGSIDRFLRRSNDGKSSDGVHRLLAFAGLDPRIRESGQWRGKIRMSKRGSRALRTAIWRAAFVARNHEAFQPTFQKHRSIMKQPFKIALSHVARKVVQAIFGVLRHQQPFDLDAFRGVVARAA